MVIVRARCELEEAAVRQPLSFLPRGSQLRGSFGEAIHLVRPPAGIGAGHRGRGMGAALAKLRPALGLPDEEIPSGAGHDAAVFAKCRYPKRLDVRAR